MRPGFSRDIGVAALPLAAAITLASGCGPAGESSHESASTLAYCCDSQAFSPAVDVDAKFLVFLPLMSGVNTGAQVGMRAVHRRVRGLRSPDRVTPTLALRHLWLEEAP